MLAYLHDHEFGDWVYENEQWQRHCIEPLCKVRMVGESTPNPIGRRRVRTRWERWREVWDDDRNDWVFAAWFGGMMSGIGIGALEVSGAPVFFIVIALGLIVSLAAGSRA